jgi:hypothetical protein
VLGPNFGVDHLSPYLVVLIDTASQNVNFARTLSPPADTQIVMMKLQSPMPERSEIRFLEYRLQVVSGWPPSPRKDATAEAISRRLASIARSTLTRTGEEDLFDSSCRLLEGVFTTN